MKYLLRILIVSTFLFSTSLLGQGFTCTSGTFWMTDNDLYYEFMLDGDTVYSTGVVIDNLNNQSLAISDNLNGDPYSPTFYAATDDRHFVQYYNGIDWTITTDSSIALFNPGGYKQHLYYMAGITLPLTQKVVRYTGQGFTDIYIRPGNRYFTVADIAVDVYGNAIIFTGTDFTTTDSVLVISPAGQVLKRFPITISSNAAYGSFYLNGVVYIGFSSINPTNPNTLIPVTITNTGATAGTPIPMPVFIDEFVDLTSCNTDEVAAVDIKTVKGLTIYPNPAATDVAIRWDMIGNANIRIIDASGGQVVNVNNINSGYKLSTAHMPNGLYLVQVMVSNSISTQRIVVSN